MTEFATQLFARSQQSDKPQCELCGSDGVLQVYSVPPTQAESLDTAICVCAACESQINGTTELNSKHWYCLKEAIWSEVAAVQVVSYRVLKRLAQETWAADLLGQMYLDEEVQEWADAEGNVGQQEEAVWTLDSNGAVLNEGDSVTLIKDLDVKGAGFVAKRGTLVKNIHHIDDPHNIEGRINKITLVLKTKFLKKV